MKDDDALTPTAEGILQRTGHLEECPHGELLSTGDDDLTDAYTAANAGVTNGQIILPQGYSRRDLTDCIKRVYENSGDECYTCSKNERD